jgi:hypothetical protein
VAQGSIAPACKFISQVILQPDDMSGNSDGGRLAQPSTAVKVGRTKL